MEKEEEGLFNSLLLIFYFSDHLIIVGFLFITVEMIHKLLILIVDCVEQYDF